MERGSRRQAAARRAVSGLCSVLCMLWGAPCPAAGDSTAEPADGYVVVTATEAAVLAAPADDAAVLFAAAKGDVFPLKGQDAGWYFVATGEAAAGWIRRDAAAKVYYPEFFDPEKLREHYTQPPYIPPSAWWYPGYPYYGYGLRGWRTPDGYWGGAWPSLPWGYLPWELLPRHRHDRRWYRDHDYDHDYDYDHRHDRGRRDRGQPYDRRRP